MMVLYLENLKTNIEQYVRLATIMKGVLELVEVPDVNFERAMETSRENLKQLGSLLANGVTELQVPEKG